jgi:hypothetical protein
MAYKGEEPRVAESSTSVGAGDFVLAGAITERRQFSAVCAVGDTFDYVIKAADGTWEEGFGTYSAANTLTRTAVKRSSNANAAVVFAAGNKTVFINFAGLSRAISEADQKNPPTGADKLGLWDSVTGLLAGLTLTNLAAWLAGLAQTLSSKTLTAPVINGATGSTAAWNIGSGQLTKDTSGNVVVGGTLNTGGQVVSSGGVFTAQTATFPFFQTYETAAVANAKYLRMAGVSGTWKLQKVNDAYTTSTDLLTVDPNGILTAAGESRTSGSFRTSNATPAVIFYETDQGANLKSIWNVLDGGTLQWQARDDADGYLSTVMTLSRVGVFSVAGAVIPMVDNTQNIGSASFRMATVYAGTGTINTSDAREKTAVTALTDAEIAAAKALAVELGSFKFLSSVAEKGAAARSHIGMTVQRAIEIMLAHDLDPMAYAFICHDKWDAVTKEVVSPTGAESREVSRHVVDLLESKKTLIELVDGAPVLKTKTETLKTPRVEPLPVVDEQGQPVVVRNFITHEIFNEAGEKTGEADEEVMAQLVHGVPVMETVVERFDIVETPAGDRYGFRADELHAFILRGLAADHEALLARIAALESP